MKCISNEGLNLKKNNPFTLAFGKPPVQLINIYEDIDNIITIFDADLTISYTHLIEGVRGGRYYVTI